MSVYSLEDETLSGVGEPPTDQLLVNVEGGEGRVVCQARWRNVDGGLSPALQFILSEGKQTSGQEMD